MLYSDILKKAPWKTSALRKASRALFKNPDVEIFFSDLPPSYCDGVFDIWKKRQKETKWLFKNAKFWSKPS